MKLSKRKILVVVSAVVLLVGTAVALSIMSTSEGTVASYDFGSFGPGFPVPGTVQIQTFNMKPGDVFPWHFHKGQAYVIILKGQLTEQELVGPNQCSTLETASAGDALVESPGKIHTVTNPGPGAAIITWATVHPKGEDASTFVSTPNCN
jgi:quercetin dioxygenase-like cupin family protein